MSTTALKPLRTWSAEKASAYRAKHPGDSLVLHFLIDASGSMEEYAEPLREAYSFYLSWLKQQCSPMALGQQVLFTHEVHAKPVQALATLPALTTATYRPEGGTALYDALGTVLTQHPEPGQHVLTIFTDGRDLHSQAWTVERCAGMLATLQAEAGWLVVFLAAFAEGLTVAHALGVPEGNALVFPGTDIPAAFRQVQDAMQRYLAAPQAERKLLTTGGFFA